MKKGKANVITRTKIPGEEIVVINAWSPLYDIYYFDMMSDADERFNLPENTIRQTLIKNHCLIIDGRYFVMLFSELNKLDKDKLKTYLNIEFYNLDHKSYIIFQLKRGNLPVDLERLKIEFPEIKPSVIEVAIKEAANTLLIDYAARPLKKRVLPGQLVDKLEAA